MSLESLPRVRSVCLTVEPIAQTGQENQAIASQGQPVEDLIHNTLEDMSFPKPGVSQPDMTGTKAQSRILGVSFASRFCASDCRCICHKQGRLNSPKILNAVLGSLFVGYKASPPADSPCQHVNCRNMSTKIVYTFPWWIWSRTVSALLSWKQPKGPELLIRLMRPRSETDDIFFALTRPMNAFKIFERLLLEGEASVVDVDTNNNTLLHVR